MKTLRVFIYHTVNDPKDRVSGHLPSCLHAANAVAVTDLVLAGLGGQPQHEGQVAGGKVLPSWTLKIEGGIVDGDKVMIACIGAAAMHGDEACR